MCTFFLIWTSWFFHLVNSWLLSDQITFTHTLSFDCISVCVWVNLRSAESWEKKGEVGYVLQMCCTVCVCVSARDHQDRTREQPSQSVVNLISCFSVSVMLSQRGLEWVECSTDTTPPHFLSLHSFILSTKVTAFQCFGLSAGCHPSDTLHPGEFNYPVFHSPFEAALELWS